MPFLDHLEELRWRIIYSLIAGCICVAIGFVVTLRFDLVGLLARPVLALIPDHVLVFTHPTDKMGIEINVAMTVGLVLAAPVIFYQAWMFIAPALHPHEKRIGLGVLYAGLVLFVSGAALADVVVIPLALPWLFDFGSPTLVPLISGSEYFSFVISMVLMFGVAFELPIVILALAALGLVTPALLGKYRRHAIVAIVIIGAFLTPGDMVWTTIAMAVPLYLLYELSVLASFVVVRRRAKKVASDLVPEARRS